MKRYKVNWKFILITIVGGGIGLFLLVFLVQSDKELKILFVGNSITKHGPRPSIGWTGNYGMAATSMENDYVYKSILYIKKDQKVNSYLAINVSGWERDFLYDKEKYLEAKNFKADIIIIRLGENINQQYAKEMDFKKIYLN